MKKLSFILTFLMCAAFAAQAQVAKDIRPSADAKMGEFSGWTNVDVTWEDGSAATVAYRIRLSNRKGIACHYEFEVMNSSKMKLTIIAKSSYYDKLVKNQFGDDLAETVKPDKSVVFKIIAQGCKKEKGADLDDFGHCMACDFGVNLHVIKK